MPQFYRCWQNTQNSGSKALLSTTQQAVWVSLAPHMPWGERKQPGTCHTYSVSGSQLKNPDFWIPCLIKGLLAHLSNLFPRKIHYLYNPVRKQIYPLPPKEREVSLFSKAVWYTDILEKIVWNKAVSASCSENVQKHKRPEENCLPK